MIEKYIIVNLNPKYKLYPYYFDNTAFTNSPKAAKLYNSRKTAVTQCFVISTICPKKIGSNFKVIDQNIALRKWKLKQLNKITT